MKTLPRMQALQKLMGYFMIRGSEWCQEPLLTGMHSRQFKQWFLTPLYSQRRALSRTLQPLVWRYDHHFVVPRTPTVS